MNRPIFNPQKIRRRTQVEKSDRSGEFAPELTRIEIRLSGAFPNGQSFAAWKRRSRCIVITGLEFGRSIYR
jgi:hypothetical protein